MAKRGRRTDKDGSKRDDLQDLEGRLADVARRSPLGLWVMQNFDEVSAMIDRYGRHWGEIAAWMTERRLFGDQVITGDAVRKSFEREAEKRKGAKQPATPKAVPASIAPTVRLMDPPKQEPAPTSDDADARIEKLKRQMAKRSGRET